MKPEVPYTAAITGALFALLGVVLGAFGAHSLENTLTEAQLVTFETAVRYQMYHAFAILITSTCTNLFLTRRSANLVTALFTAGIVLFSGSLYAYTGTGLRFLVYLTPVGGLTLILGWAAFIITALHHRRKDAIDETIH